MYIPTKVSIQPQDVKYQKVLSYAVGGSKQEKISLLAALQVRYPDAEHWQEATATVDPKLSARVEDNVPSQGWTAIAGTSNGRSLFIWHPRYGGYTMGISQYLGYISVRGALEAIQFQFVQDMHSLSLLPVDMTAKLTVKPAGTLLNDELYLSMLTSDDIGIELRKGRKKYVYCGPGSLLTSNPNVAETNEPRAKLLDMTTFQISVTEGKELTTREYTRTPHRHPYLTMLQSYSAPMFTMFLENQVNVFKAAFANKKTLLLNFRILHVNREAGTRAALIDIPQLWEMCAQHYINLSPQALNHMLTRRYYVTYQDNRYKVAYFTNLASREAHLIVDAASIEEMSQKLSDLLHFKEVAKLFSLPDILFYFGITRD